jgi:hypothetical protein
MGKEYKTRDGYEVVILATNGRGLYSVVGQINDGVDWVHENWTADGTVFIDRRYSPRDLIEIKPVRLFERWVNVHHDGSSSCFITCEDAAAFATKMGRIACLHIRQEYTEGDGLCDSEKT